MYCKTCQAEKPDIEFDKNRKTWCKDCRRKRARDQYQLKKESILVKAKEYRETHKESLRERAQKWYEKNKDKVISKTKQYKVNNRTKVRLRQNSYQRKRKASDPKFKLRCNISTAIYQALASRGSKKLTSIENSLGYTAQQLIEHLEKQFTPEMNWENYGSYWHVDHIKPDSWFDYISDEDEAFKECWSLENLQPLPAKINWSKKDRYIG